MLKSFLIMFRFLFILFHVLLILLWYSCYIYFLFQEYFKYAKRVLKKKKKHHPKELSQWHGRRWELLWQTSGRPTWVLLIIHDSMDWSFAPLRKYFIPQQCTNSQSTISTLTMRIGQSTISTLTITIGQPVKNTLFGLC